ncbi:hypothetical protein PoB_005057600 [Plakobranchus ocellatus]|uniref:Uncharacterized protein n=1 Tax=Plakobranchus ocellatus TaxID=259542 RepID=A0AAV4BL92_9GAST|nr:hypothetical protein PoB_005057600 [Plakobranchus ocellatus]
MDLSDHAECPLTVSIAVGEAQICCEDLQELREARHSKSCLESHDLAPVHINSFGLLCFWVNPGDCICWKELKVFPFLLDIFGFKCRTESSSQTDLDTLRLIAEDRPKWNALVAEIRKTAKAARSDDPASGRL